MEFNATFLFTAISFIVFVFIMNKIFYKPIEKIVNERESFVDENYDEAKKNNLCAKKLIDEYDKKIDSANYEGKSIIEEKSLNAKNHKAELIFDAQKKAVEDIKTNETELEAEFNAVKTELKPEVQNLADKMTSKMFGNNINNSEDFG